MKNTLKISILALGLMFSGAAFAGETKPVKPAETVKVDTLTTGSTEPSADNFKCNAGFADFKALKACNDGSAYPVNPMSGLNLN